jgi:ribonuclease HI
MYVINCDASIEPYNPGGIMAWAFIVRSLVGPTKGEIHREAGLVGQQLESTNNVAEYCAVIAALAWLLKLPDTDRKPTIIQSDSQLIVNQCSGQWAVNDQKLQPLHTLVREAKQAFGRGITFKWIPREQNADADELSRSLYTTEMLQTLRDRSTKDLFGSDDVPW